jgi:hypothetical protein
MGIGWQIAYLARGNYPRLNEDKFDLSIIAIFNGKASASLLDIIHVVSFNLLHFAVFFLFDSRPVDCYC